MIGTVCHERVNQTEPSIGKLIFNANVMFDKILVEIDVVKIAMFLTLSCIML